MLVAPANAGDQRLRFARGARLVTAFALAMLAATAANAAPPTTVQRETDALIAALGTSGCRFERNGRWHDAAAAQAHLRKKEAWLRERGLVPTTEAFVERAATSSSVSGKPYRMQCGAAAPVASATWLRARLATLRRGMPTSR